MRTFDGATLTGANFTGAEVRGANFIETLRGTGLTAAQLYSTASYQAHDLTGIRLGRQQSCRREPRRPEPHECKLGLCHADRRELDGAEIRGANFHRDSDLGERHSAITPAQLYSTASYQAHDLTGISLAGNFAGLNLAGQNLTDASFRWETDLTGAICAGQPHECELHER